MKRLVIEQGRQYGKLTIVKEVEPIISPQGHLKRIFECKCECGVVKNVRLSLLSTNQTTSCGCFHKQKISSIFKKHGDSFMVEYKCWVDMLIRCNNQTHKAYRHYGGRGIKVDESFIKWENFKQYLITTIGLRPSNEYSLDRINNDGNYEPGNIRWSTQTEQLKNRRSNKIKLNS